MRFITALPAGGRVLDLGCGPGGSALLMMQAGLDVDAIDASPQPPILVAHSLGCLVAAHWAARHHRPLHALLLVAVPDPEGPNFPADAKGFAPLPAVLPAQRDLPRRVLMSSTSDPYSTPGFSAQCASAWNAEHVVLGARGHLNADSGLGDWPQGWELVARWRGE